MKPKPLSQQSIPRSPRGVFRFISYCTTPLTTVYCTNGSRFWDLRSGGAARTAVRYYYHYSVLPLYCPVQALHDCCTRLLLPLYCPLQSSNVYSRHRSNKPSRMAAAAAAMNASPSTRTRKFDCHERRWCDLPYDIIAFFWCESSPVRAVVASRSRRISV